MKVARLVLLCLVVAACTRVPEQGSPTLTATLAPSATPSPTATATSAPTTDDCFWNWGTRELPELSAQVQAAALAAGLTGVTVSAAAYGEDCIDPQTGLVKRFATLETDFYFTLPVEDLGDSEALGKWVERVLAVLDGFPPGTTPGPQPGYVGIHFVAGTEWRNLWFKSTQAAEARQRGLHGAALLEALGYLPVNIPGPTDTLTPTPRTATPFPVSITPAEQTLPAGASTGFFLSAPEGVYPSWSVADLPPGVTAEFLPDANPANSALFIHTSCATPPGSYALDIQATIPETTRLVRVVAVVHVTERLADSQPGMFSGSFKDNTILVRRGGPSTMQYGPFLTLQFCAGAEPRKLRIVVQSAVSDAGTPLAEPPRFSLFRSLVWPMPESIQTMSGGYKPTAREVARNDGWTLEWDIADGLYVLAFLRSPLEDGYPEEQRPAAVEYRVEIGE